MGRTSFLIFYHSWPLCSRSLEIAAGGKQKKQLPCFVTGEPAILLTAFPFQSPPQFYLGGARQQGQRSVPRFKGPQRGDKQGEGVVQDLVGREEGQGVLAVRASLPAPPRAGPAVSLLPHRMRSSSKAVPNVPHFLSLSLSSGDVCNLLPTPGLDCKRSAARCADPAPRFSDHVSG